MDALLFKLSLIKQIGLLETKFANINKTNVMVFNNQHQLMHSKMYIWVQTRWFWNFFALRTSTATSESNKALRKPSEKRHRALSCPLALRTLDTRALITTKTMLKLVVSLVKPVATYTAVLYKASINLYQQTQSHVISKKPNITKPYDAAKDALTITF